jgi:hypothetical protein
MIDATQRASVGRLLKCIGLLQRAHEFVSAEATMEGAKELCDAVKDARASTEHIRDDLVAQGLSDDFVALETCLRDHVFGPDTDVLKAVGRVATQFAAPSAQSFREAVTAQFHDESALRDIPNVEGTILEQIVVSHCKPPTLR